MSVIANMTVPDAQGHFGPYGGRYVPETLMHPLQELEAEYFRAQQDPAFQNELQYYLREFCGRPNHRYQVQVARNLASTPRSPIMQIAPTCSLSLTQMRSALTRGSTASFRHEQ